MSPMTECCSSLPADPSASAYRIECDNATYLYENDSKKKPPDCISSPVELMCFGKAACHQCILAHAMASLCLFQALQPDGEVRIVRMASILVPSPSSTTSADSDAQYTLLLVVLPPGAATTDVLTNPVARNLVPLDLLSRHRQLPSQTFEGAFAQACEPPVQLFLVSLLSSGNLFGNCGTGTRRDRTTNGLIGDHPHVAVLVVVHVDLYAALKAARRRIVDVEGAPPTVPEMESSCQ